MTFPAIRISERELQDKFNRNEGGYPGKIDALRRQTVYSSPASAKSRQRPGTMSVLYKYWDGNLAVMYLHCFVEPTGELGAQLAKSGGWAGHHPAE